jgi:hypothetical protein
MQGNIQLKGTRSQTCTSCNGALKLIGKIPFRIEQTPKFADLVFKPSLNEYKEALCPLDVYRCEKCGRLELYDLDFSMRE